MSVVEDLIRQGLYVDALNAPRVKRDEFAELIDRDQGAQDTVPEYWQPGDKIHATSPIYDRDGRDVMQAGDRAVILQVVPDGHRRIIYAATCSPAEQNNREWRAMAMLPGAEAGLRRVCLVWPCTIARVPHMLDEGDPLHARERKEDREYSAVMAGAECSGGCSAESAPDGICKFTGRDCPRISSEPITRFATNFLNWLDTINTETIGDVYSTH